MHLETIHSFSHEICPAFVGRSKKDKKKRKEVQDSPEKEGEGCNQEEVYIISSVDDDCSKGMKSMNCLFSCSALLFCLLLKLQTLFI